MPDSTVRLAPTPTGCCIRVKGSGTMRQSPAARDAATRVLASATEASVVFDLSTCDYLDSTFLGVLIDLYRQFGKRGADKRYSIAAPPERRRQLFGPTHLDRLIPMSDTPPATCGAWVELPASDLSKRDLVRHVMEAHRALAQVDCPMREIFGRIADEMEKELNSG